MTVVVNAAACVEDDADADGGSGIYDGAGADHGTDADGDPAADGAGRMSYYRKDFSTL
jgi:hypothetical protein